MIQNRFALMQPMSFDKCHAPPPSELLTSLIKAHSLAVRNFRRSPTFHDILIEQPERIAPILQLAKDATASKDWKTRFLAQITFGALIGERLGQKSEDRIALEESVAPFVAAGTKDSNGTVKGVAQSVQSIITRRQKIEARFSRPGVPGASATGNAAAPH